MENMTIGTLTSFFPRSQVLDLEGAFIEVAAGSLTEIVRLTWPGMDPWEATEKGGFKFDIPFSERIHYHLGCLDVTCRTK